MPKTITFDYEDFMTWFDEIASIVADYRTKEEVEEWKKRDPIERLQDQLLLKKILTQSEIDEIHDVTMRELGEAVKFATESPEPRVEEALEDIYYTTG